MASFTGKHSEHLGLLKLIVSHIPETLEANYK